MQRIWKIICTLMIYQICRKKFMFLCLCCLLVLSSCRDTGAEKIESSIKDGANFLNRSIRFAPLFLDYRNSLNSVLWEKKNKIILYLDSLDCTSCTFNEIRKWNLYNKDLIELNTEIVIICSHPDVETVRNIKKSVFVDYPLFFDVDKHFVLENDVPKNAMFQAFVVGSTNQVIWVGLPIRSKESWEKFCSMIRLLNDDPSF